MLQKQVKLYFIWLYYLINVLIIFVWFRSQEAIPNTWIQLQHSRNTSNPKSTLKQLRLWWHCQEKQRILENGWIKSTEVKRTNQASYNLLLIMCSICLLARKELALPYNESDEYANLLQLLHLRAEDKPQLLKWLEKIAQ